VSEQDVGVWEEKGFARRGSVCIMVWVLYLHMREGRRGGSTYIHTYIHTYMCIYLSIYPTDDDDKAPLQTAR
jgi:hypothetical protein